MDHVNLRHVAFSEVDLEAEFFSSLKADYPTFKDWYRSKCEEHADAYVSYGDDGELQGFLYMKIELERVDDVTPPIVANRILKIGTFKIDAHGTKMGEHFLKVIFDYAIDQAVDVCYLTIFEKHAGLTSLIKEYGFEKYGIKEKDGKIEDVYTKRMYAYSGDIFKDYPVVNTDGHKKYLLSIYPKYHSVMFPESILTNESRNIIKDISYTNSIQKVYICSMQGVEELEKGDLIVLYRTAESGRSAEYSAVATTVCTVVEIRLQQSFDSFEAFYAYANKYTMFDEADLRYWYNRGGLKIIRLVYNFPLRKRIVRHELIEQIGLIRDQYWGFFELSDDQFERIVEYGQSKDYLSRTHVW